MASGIVSTVITRLFHSKTKDKKNSTQTGSINTRKSGDGETSASASSMPSINKPESTIATNIDDRLPMSLSEAVTTKADRYKKKSLFFSSIRRKSRPFSCFVVGQESPTAVRKIYGREQSKEENTSIQQLKEKKTKRPLSCIVHPPSHRLPEVCPSLTSSPSARGRKGMPDPVMRDSKNQQTCYSTARPVSCFVELADQRLPPPYPGRPQYSLAHSSEAFDQILISSQPALSHVKSSPAVTQSYPESPNRSPPQPASFPHFFSEDTSRQDACNIETRRQRLRSMSPLPVYAQTSQFPPYSRHQPIACCENISKQSIPKMLNCGSLEQLDRIAGSYSSQKTYRSQPSTPRQACRSYDLKAYFPSVHQASRPPSACFLCESQPCCVEAQTACRPMSQCYLPGCNLPSHVQQFNVRENTVEKEHDQLMEELFSQPDPHLDCSRSSEASLNMSSRRGYPKTNTAEHPPVPRRMSAGFTSLESKSSSTSSRERSPGSSTPPSCFTLKKYRSADCLDRVDELQSLDVSPPPARPLSYFNNAHDKQTIEATGSRDEIFTSIDMLEKVGHPSSSKHLPRKCRPVSCFAGSADESGYFSNGTLGEIGWLKGLSASTGDILEILDGDEVNVADDELSFERASSFRKAWSVCSLLRQDSIQDRSFTVMRQRRQKMKSRRQITRRSSTETDEGSEVNKASHSASSLLQESGKEPGESSRVTGIPLERKLHVPRSHGSVRRLHSVHMKSWEMRLRRKQLMVKKRNSEKLHPRKETLV